MKYRGLIVSAAVVASVGVVAAVATAVIARAVDRDDPAAEAPPIGTTLAPGLLAALERDLGLSEEEAYDRLHFEAWAGQTAAALRDELGEDRFAGAWLSEDGHQLVVAVTDDQAAERVREAGAEPEVVSRGAAYLRQVLAALDEHSQEIADTARELAAAVSGWYVDVSSNTVVVQAPPEAEPAARDLADAVGGLATAIRIEFSDEPPRLFNDVRGGDPYVIGGVGQCSVGFAVEERARETAAGFVTAGHCALSGTSVTGLDGSPMGEFVAAAFPGVGSGEAEDWAVVSVNDDWSLQPLVNDYQGGTLPVAGSVEAPVGASVCRYGSTTGVSCGVIEATDATVIYPEGRITGMVRTSACAEPGDSGGAWLSGDQAQGVTSGGSGDCTIGGTTFFQPLNEILERNRLTLVTTVGDGGAAPPPVDDAAPPAGDCDGYRYSFQGQLTGPDYVRVEPSERYYRALGSGTHTVCMAGPAGAGFYLILQQWDGQAWQNVAESPAPTAQEQLSFTGTAGYYRIGVVSEGDTGGYVVGLDFS